MKRPPRKPLSQPGDVLEGVLIWEQEATDSWGKDVLDIRLATSDGREVSYRCSVRLWTMLADAAGDAQRPRFRITRTADLPAIGNGKPIRNWTVELLNGAVPAPPQPQAKQPSSGLVW